MYNNEFKNVFNPFNSIIEEILTTIRERLRLLCHEDDIVRSQLEKRIFDCPSSRKWLLDWLEITLNRHQDKTLTNDTNREFKIEKIKKVSDIIKNANRNALDYVVTNLLGSCAFRITPHLNLIYPVHIHSLVTTEYDTTEALNTAVPFERGCVGELLRCTGSDNFKKPHPSQWGGLRSLADYFWIQDYYVGYHGVLLVPVFNVNESFDIQATTRDVAGIVAVYFPLIDFFADEQNRLSTFLKQKRPATSLKDFPIWQAINESIRFKASAIVTAWALQDKQKEAEYIQGLLSEQVKKKLTLPGSKGWWDDILNFMLEGLEGISMVTAWRIIHRANPSLQYTTGKMSELIFTRQFVEEFERSLIFPSWESVTQARIELYVESFCNVFSWKDAISWELPKYEFETFESKEIIEIKKKQIMAGNEEKINSLLRKGRIGQNPQINKSLDVYQYEEPENIIDLFVPLITRSHDHNNSEDEWHGVLRINCIQRLKKLRHDLKVDLTTKLEKPFEEIASPLQLFKNLEKDCARLFEFKFARDLRNCYGQVVVEYLTSEELNLPTRRIHDIFHIAKIILRLNIDEKLIENVIRSLTEIKYVLSPYMHECIVVISIWFIENEFCLTDIVDSISSIHENEKSISSLNQYSYLHVHNATINEEFSSNSKSIRSIVELFGQYPVYRLLQNLVGSRTPTSWNSGQLN